jgi:hypothetical protein
MRCPCASLPCANWPAPANGAAAKAKAALAIAKTASAAPTRDCATPIRAFLLARRRTVEILLRYFTFTFGGGCSCGRIDMADVENRP